MSAERESAGSGQAGPGSSDRDGRDPVADAVRRGALSALLISDLRAGRTPAAQTLLDLGLRPDQAYTAVVADVDGGGELERAVAVAGATDGLPTVHAVIDGLSFALIPGELVALGDGGTLARGSRRPLAHAAASLAEAEHAYETAESFGVTGLVDLQGLTPLPIVTATATLAAAASAERFARLDALGPAGAEVEAAIAALLEHDLSIDATAEALGVHRNTVRARRRRFRELTGLDIARTRDLVTAWWMLSWRRSGRR